MRDQTMSQLAAVGAPTQQFQIVLLGIFSLLVIAFGADVWKSAVGKRSLIITAIIIIFGQAGLITSLFPQTAMQLEEGLAPQMVHIIVTAMSVLLIVLFIGFGAAASGIGFRIFSAAMIITFLLFGFLAAIKATQAVNFTYPWMGILERVSNYSYLLWILVFAAVLLLDERTAPKLSISQLI
ncbi:MAG: DUF998 domain-containing protein [Candidatus Saccharicenans sp.]|uniref:DUF998 domain-containing protein n=1 Tax=Candidatus Saccharicenans sp. TaxID=2819258 RepID=UPI0040498DF3